ncbi:Protein of unknown function [Geodermatophilus pulveris]|uniref:DUF3048 domain-containing protein n=1 Tax=Geodermatophilus pulveris TaxID=1564159 RepID=A0A239I6W8_9ACTN|nr:DUF3048 domain-containing protein [Geodermatophilus pulveris]SNS89340.1 Protein of unknown function [Geodermatophilus pulveris]
MTTVRRCLAAALLAGLALSVTTACGSPAAPEPASAAEAAPASPPPPPPVRWPLTGVDSAGADVARPALAVKVENSAAARPQTGLGAADVVWEEVVEGGISRYVAVYHSTLPPAVGPVRSVRPMDPAIAGPLRGLFAFSGGQKPFVEATGAAGLQVLKPGIDGFYRIPERVAPHNTYVDPAALVAQADPAHAAAPPAQFAVAAPGEQPTAVAAGTPAGLLDLRLSRVATPRWTWSAPDGAWLRAEGSTPAVGADGAVLRAANVVVLRVDVVDTRFVDSAGNPVPETVMVGGGEALVATGGKAVPATWRKASVGEPVVLTGADGQPVRLAEGSTWVELVPNGTGAVTTG